MFQELVNATVNMINVPNFIPYHPDDYDNVQQFELYLNNLLLLNLGNAYSRNSEPGFGRRKFDLKRYDHTYGCWLVCEIGHEKSSRGYLNSPGGNPNKMGLINKLFFDYVKNYRFLQMTPRSYAILYFSLELGFNLNAVNALFNTIKGLYPRSHNFWDYYFNNAGSIPCGRILIIDCLIDLNSVRSIYQANPHIHQYINPIERGLNKHNILMGIQNPPY